MRNDLSHDFLANVVGICGQPGVHPDKPSDERLVKFDKTGPILLMPLLLQTIQQA